MNKEEIQEKEDWAQNVEIRELPSTYGNKYFPEIKMGRSLFAVHRFDTGDIVLGYPTGHIKVNSEIAQRQIIDKMFPDRPVHMRPYGDISIMGPNSNTILIDQNINVHDLAASGSYWYAINHSKSANLKMKWDKVKKNLYWFATRTIYSGEELTYDYGNVPDEWNQEFKTISLDPECQEYSSDKKGFEPNENINPDCCCIL